MGNIWGIHHLTPHPDSPARNVEIVTGQLLGFDTSSIFLEWCVMPVGSVLLPEPAPQARKDGLWRTTCFEVFLKSASCDAYLELNFSSSFGWAAYAFDRYREGMRPMQPRLEPEIWRASPGEDYFHLSAEFDVLAFLSQPVLLNMTAVIEERDGTKSYWALAHPPEGPPDFHHPACFVLELPPPA